VSGCSDWNDIELYGQTKEPWLKNFLKLPNGIPSHDTFNRVFAALDPLALEQCFVEWIQQVAMITEGKVVSIDGKRLRRSGSGGKKSFIHMVSAWSNENEMVLGQSKVDDKSNEITVIPTLLEVLDLEGSIITIDAMGCQRNIAEKIVDKGADYVLALKGNQGNLLDDVTEAFNETPDGESVSKETSLGHGRIEKRTCRVIKDTSWICKSEEWKGLQSLVRIESERSHKNTGETQREVRYYISSLSGDASLHNKAIREHWGIENKLHWTLDVVFGEDQSQKRAGNAAQNFSIITRIALNLLKNYKTKKFLSMKNKRNKAGWDNEFLLDVITNLKI
jgi:predicted transposase YbfD/YdcC